MRTCATACPTATETDACRGGGGLALLGICLGFFLVLPDARIGNVSLRTLSRSSGGSLPGGQGTLNAYIQAARPRFPWPAGRRRAVRRSRAPRAVGGAPVTPKTILAWHRALGRPRRPCPQRRPGRPASAQETVQLSVRLARENPRRRGAAQASPRAASPRCCDAMGLRSDDQQHLDRISADERVRGDYGQPFHLGLRHQEPIEGIAMMVRKCGTP